MCHYFHEFRENIDLMLEEHHHKIGYSGIIVQNDECHLGKRKYNRGHKVDGVWVWGGIEQNNEKKLFLIEVPDRKKTTLTDLIQQHVIEGSIIVTDGWKVCNGLSGLCEHYIVNHSLMFKDSETGASTNTIEEIWNAVKHNILPRNQTVKVKLHLNAFIWKRLNKENLWEAFMNILG